VPEGSADAAILIAISWQALNRVIRGNSKTLLADCTVLILFAGFFVEANLNYIIEEMGMTERMRKFLHKDYPGLQDKLGWYYNEFVARSRATNKKQMYDNGIKRKLRTKFPGLAKILRFRNDISHGKINESARSVSEARRLRAQAKTIVDILFDIADNAGFKIDRDITYDAAIAAVYRTT